VLALGAQAAWLGTRFMLAEEAPVHPHYRQRVVDASETDAILRYSCATALAGMTGDIPALSLWAGQSVALATRVQPAAEIVAEIVAELVSRL
jgi:NAD(P)H-dependent flavin oxidoreductase YrpB (nitropropane dioxygenase family)